MVLKILDYTEEPFKYKLKDIAEDKEVELALNTARAYLTKVLPPSCVHKKGDKRGTRYNENTLNSFKVLRMLLDEKVLKKEQITAVMEALGQRQINRIVMGEPLRVHIAVNSDGDESKQAGPASIASANEQVLLVDGNEVTPIGVNQEERLSGEQSQDDGWDVFPISESLQLKYRGELTKEQQEELFVAARILKSIVEG